ncbi:MAG: hypothetical protein AB7U83_20055 [Vicinamibacterales bacterium]
MELPVRWLSCHVHYACRHSGVCCRSGWPLPVEHAAVAAIDDAVVRGKVWTVDGHAEWLDESASAPAGVAGTFRQADGGCVFHVPASPLTVRAGSRSRYCGLHAGLGHAALPASCQHFPRLCLVDDHGVRVSLSHHCPTAASMLVDHEAPVTIVDGPAPVPGRPVPEGLDVRGELPPRLTDRVLMDADGLAAWEAHVVGVLAGPGADGSPELTLARVQADARRLAGWTPAHGRLRAAVAALPEEGRGDDLGVATALLADARTWPAWFDLVADSCRGDWLGVDPPKALAGLDARLVTPTWPHFAGAVRRYLAARAFVAWVSYQADAVRALAGWLALCHATLRIECARACGEAGRVLDRDLLLQALRQADLLLCHYADPLAMAGALADSGTPPGGDVA